MQMENLETIIKAAAETTMNALQLPGTYLYARKGDYTHNHDLPSPHLVFFDPTSREGEIIGSYSCLFLFAEPDPDTEDKQHRYELTRRMFTLANRFFAELDKHDMLLIGERTTEKIVQEFQGRMSGIAVQRTIVTPLPLDCEGVTL
jgi:hypothetical protein